MRVRQAVCASCPWKARRSCSSSFPRAPRTPAAHPPVWLLAAGNVEEAGETMRFSCTVRPESRLIFLRNDARDGLDFSVVKSGGLPEHRHRAAGNRRHAVHHPHRGCLSAPLGPRNAKHSPSPISNEMPFTAVNSSNFFVRSLATIAAFMQNLSCVAVQNDPARTVTINTLVTAPAHGIWERRRSRLERPLDPSIPA